VPAALEEKIAILVDLAGRDEELGAVALETLRRWDGEELKQVLADPATPSEVLDFALTHLVEDRPELVEALTRNPALGPESPAAGATDSAAASPSAEPAAPGPAEEFDASSPERQTLLQRIARMSAAQRIRLALMGSAEERMILIRDPNKAVARAVLHSPKLSDVEAEAYASMKAVTEEVLRSLAMNRSRMKHYPVVRALANNPRAPIDVALPLVPRLKDRDLKALSINKNVAEVLRAAAAKLYRERTAPRAAAFPRKP
jgi:hypothetical protein